MPLKNFRIHLNIKFVRMTGELLGKTNVRVADMNVTNMRQNPIIKAEMRKTIIVSSKGVESVVILGAKEKERQVFLVSLSK